MSYNAIRTYGGVQPVTGGTSLLPKHSCAWGLHRLDLESLSRGNLTVTNNNNNNNTNTNTNTGRY